MKRTNFLFLAIFFCVTIAFAQSTQEAAQSSSSKPAQQPNPNTPASAPSIFATPPAVPVGQLKLSGKLKFYGESVVAPRNFLVPAAGALYRMANPVDQYPREWKDGGGAFGRNYGDILARDVSGKTARFAAGALLREDPRYFPSEDRRLGARVFHAIKFTLIDKADSGSDRIAVSNFASAIAGGFIGDAYLPPGFRNVTHAGQRSISVLWGTAAQNELSEFSPEIRILLKRMHVPFVP